MKDEKNPAQELREKLFAQPKHAALRMSDDEISAAFEWCKDTKPSSATTEPSAR